MKLEGEYRIEVPREAVWEGLLDAEVMAGSLPGCEGLERTEENTFAGDLNVEVGPVKGKFKGKLMLSDLVPAEGYHFRIEGRGPAGFVNGEGDLQLVDDDGATVLRYQVDAKVGGRIAGVGQRLLDSSAKVITRQGFEGFERQLVARHQAEGGAAAQVEAPSQAAFAARVAGGVVAELVPPRWRPWLAAAGVLVLAVVGVVVVRSCF